MKKWKRPEVVTVREEEIRGLVIAGACSPYCPGMGFQAPLNIKN